MENKDHNQNHQSEDLPQVLLLKPTPVMAVLGEHQFSSNKYQFLKAWESPLPLCQFLTKYANSIQAILCSGAASVTDDLLQLLPSVRLVVAASAGTNHIDLMACCRRGISVTNAGNVFSDDGADAAVGLLFDILRKISAADRYVRQGLWVKKGDYALGSKKKTFVSYPFYSNICELAADSDALIICCALTDQTRHMINKEVLSALGKEGVIVNIGRGAIIDEKELVRCLVEGEIAGAGLDVFEKEPDIPKQLLELENVVLSPHNAVFTPESFLALSELVVGNLEAFFSNLPLLSPVMDE
ncbi:hypothetical protein GH714_019530 [Hevea brasiliensis]|uniref:glyoxylate reductase (NADP(+)) n=1 Tax=Hevea brasiliensis TaxID=3981 RepID=A0A6A6MDX7_HEVBR|nr:hypothetical protein GH714_019530 [Hevea brasiliensis]